ncbi:hypothetical protein SDC9_129718 [bioreactor metagenome]|uniref:Uncharacterized protein n=1 Tax=bioreactor metagenome TaxID=1076179 RepID=A0A645CZR7_9ZZZZ
MHAFAAKAFFVAVAQLQRFKLAGRSAAGRNTGCKAAIRKMHLCLHGRVAARVDHLATNDFYDCCIYAHRIASCSWPLSAHSAVSAEALQKSRVKFLDTDFFGCFYCTPNLLNFIVFSKILLNFFKSKAFCAFHAETRRFYFEKQKGGTHTGRHRLFIYSVYTGKSRLQNTAIAAPNNTAPAA